MIKEDRETTANQEHHEKEIEEMAIADPEREPVRPSEVVGINLRYRRNRGQSCYRNLNPGGEGCGQNHGSDSDENGGANPNPESAVFGVVHCRVRRIEGNHA